jgi:hypothetical protein
VKWLRRVVGGARWDGTRGRPTSANAASSFHLTWDVPAGEWIGAEAVLEVETAPTVPALYFWALQVSFVDDGRSGGGAHLGLQWYPAHPGSTAVNWGGYGPDGRELAGSPSALASATGNVNTRDYSWSAGRRYRLEVEKVGGVGADGHATWRGAVTDVASGTRTIVRELFARGTRLEAPIVWSEIFADCDAPSASVRWSNLALVATDGQRTSITAARVNYQPVHDGGCITTDSTADQESFAQMSGTERRTPQGARLVLGADQQSRS